MTKPDKTSSYGMYLQAVRVEKGIPLETVAAETRIRAEILRAIEAEDHKHLPGDVFVKGFLKSYAEAIGADPDETLRRFADRRGPLSAEVIQLRETPKRPGSFWWTLVWVALLMTGLVGGTLLTYQMVYRNGTGDAPRVSMPAAPEAPVTEGRMPPANASEEQSPSADAPQEQMPAPVPPGGEPDTGEPFPDTDREPASAGYLLEIVCHEDTWLKAIADDGAASEHYLKPGDTLRLKAERMFNLLIGNASGVSLQLNGTPVAVPGRSGEVVNLELP